MIFWDKNWTPICGYYFWDNPFGANKFCEQLGCYSGGEVFPTNYASGWKTLQNQIQYKQMSWNYTVDAFRFGSCRKNDKWGRCTGGCNDNKIGGSCDVNSSAICESGHSVRINITCSCSCTKSSSCTGNVVCFDSNTIDVSKNKA